MKKIFALLMICALVLVTGCGGGDKPADKPAGGGEGAKIRLGMITYLNATEQKMEEYLSMIEEDAQTRVTKHIPAFYDSLKLMQMGIESDSVDEISTYNCVAKYLVATNNKYETVEDILAHGLSDQFCFAVRKDDTALKTDLDKALTAMKSDGTLDKLVKTYITDVKADNIPAVEIPHFDGADTLKVGVTGDLPPLDFITADGAPAGFNTAMLAEIAKRLNKNIELVQIESGARAAALSSKKIDVIFWAIFPNGGKIPADVDKPEGVEFTEPYFKDDVTHLKLKK